METFPHLQKTKRTIKKTRADLNNFRRWARQVIPPTELNNLLAHFFVKIRKQNGEEFEPDTLTSLSRSFDGLFIYLFIFT